MREPKIFFIPSMYDGCYYYRGYLPGVYSDSMVVSDFISKKFDTERITEQARRADIVVIQRPNELYRANLAKSLKALGKKIVFDNDDSYLPDISIPMEKLENDKQRDMARQMSKFLNDTLRISDGAITSTEPLAREYREINSNTIVLKNCIDPMDEMPCKKNETGKFRVGVIGSVTINDDYIHIKDQIKQLDERGDITFVVFGIKYKDGKLQPTTGEDLAFWSSLKNVEWQHFVPVNEYYMTIANLALDLAIIPRKEQYFNQCKSNLKFLEMSLLHIPVIAQGFKDGTSPYQGIDGKYMTIVVDNSQWYAKILEAKDNYGRYKMLAEKANYHVLHNYNIKKVAQEWKQSIINLVK